MQKTFFKKLVIANPKRREDASTNKDQAFPYYAGYSTSFTSKLLKSAELAPDALVFDPWNGAGTTVQTAHTLGLRSIGIDLNPAMVIVAKATLLSSLEIPSLDPLAISLLTQAADLEDVEMANDPLCTWMSADSAQWIRKLERQTNQSFVSNEVYLHLTTTGAMNHVAPIAAFFYVAIFRTVRRLLREFVPTNPTWVKSPGVPQGKKRPPFHLLKETFLVEVKSLAASLKALNNPTHGEGPEVGVFIGSSENLTLESGSVDFVLSSPPYCTRIDYAVATAIELAVLRIGDREFDSLRRSLMGTSTVEPGGWASHASWGLTCSAFLQNLYSHPSKASKTYYYKSHLQYFDSLYRSLRELSRVLKGEGSCVLVVQDSHYKELHNDVPTMVSEMGEDVNLRLRRRVNFSSDQSMVNMNKNAKKYLESRRHVESVLCFEKG